MLKKIIVLFVCCASFSLTAQSQSANSRKDFQINAGIGLTDPERLPFYLGVDYFIHRKISLGASTRFRYDKGEDWYTRTPYRAYSVGTSIHANYHFLGSKVKRWDLYAGLHGGIHVGVSIQPDIDRRYIRYYLGGQVGVRYYVTPKIGINLEMKGAGYHFTNEIRLGTTIKL